MGSQTPNFNFKAPEGGSPDNIDFSVNPNLQLSSDLEWKRNFAIENYNKMKDPVAKELALLLAEAAIASANYLNINTGDKTYQQTI